MGPTEQKALRSQRTRAAECRTGVDLSSDLRVASIAVLNSLTNQVCNPRVSHTQESPSALVVDSTSSVQQSHLTLSRFTAGGSGRRSDSSQPRIFATKIPKIPTDRSMHTLLTNK